MTRATPPAQAVPAPTVLVWDHWVRLCHWGLVAGVAVAYFLPADILALHLSAGYLVMALLVFRLVWGVAGTPHARFAGFVPAPAHSHPICGQYCLERRRASSATIRPAQ